MRQIGLLAVASAALTTLLAFFNPQSHAEQSPRERMSQAQVLAPGEATEAAAPARAVDVPEAASPTRAPVRVVLPSPYAPQR